jgi:hypothetical protein
MEIDSKTVTKAFWKQSGCNPDHTSNEYLINTALEFVCDVYNQKVIIVNTDTAPNAKKTRKNNLETITKAFWVFCDREKEGTQNNYIVEGAIEFAYNVAEKKVVIIEVEKEKPVK